MRMREGFSKAAKSVTAAALLALVWPGAQAEGPGSLPESVTSSSTERPSGIITVRLNRKQREIWRAMEQIVLARDDFDRPLHPLLHDLYAWAAGGDFAIYIEMPEPASVSPYKAAECVRDRTARNSANQPTLVVRLYTRVIDQARIDGRTRAFDGFVPFVGLTREERYCESLAHELAHARDLLTNPECARLLQEQEELNVQFLQLVQARGRDEPQRQKRLALVRLLGDLGEKIEKPAIEVEQQVWRELSATRRLRSAPR